VFIMSSRVVAISGRCQRFAKGYWVQVDFGVKASEILRHFQIFKFQADYHVTCLYG
jgi:hypothetical protein